jgi:iron complex transport system permease protein
VSGASRSCRPTPRLAAALAFAAACAVVGALLGPSETVTTGDALEALFGGDAPRAAQDVVWIDRVPRVALGLAVGAALAVAGLLFQGLLRNPLADPYLIGVGPGAVLGATVATTLGLGGLATVGGFSAVGTCAFVGALGAAALVLLAAGRGDRPDATRVLLAGVAIGAFVTAVATGVLYLGGHENLQHVAAWILGTLAWANDARIAVAATAAVALSAVAWAYGRELDAMTLGEDAARLVGVDVGRALRLLAVVACCLAAAAVAAAGLVGFVGLVVPHLARGLVGPTHRAAIPAAALLGAGLLVLADGVARTVAKVELPVGIVTALLGAPVFGLLLRRSAPS